MAVQTETISSSAITGGMSMVRFFAILVVLSACGCVAQQPHIPDRTGSTPPPSIKSEARPSCSRINVIAIKTRQHYEDYYGTMVTGDRSSLRSPGRTFRWGITNSEPLEMAYFAAYVKQGGKYGHFRASIYIDDGIRAPMVFLFRRGDRNGEVLKSITVTPGETEKVDFKVVGVKKMYIGSELRINHGNAVKLIIGEPEFYNCR